MPWPTAGLTQTDLLGTFILGAFAAFLGVAVALRSHHPRRAAIAAFLLLVGASLLSEGAWQFLRDFDINFTRLHWFNEIPGILAGGTWLSLSWDAWRPRTQFRWLGVILALPMMLAWILLDGPLALDLRLLNSALLGTTALAFLVAAHAKASDTAKGRATSLLVAGCLLTIPNLAETFSNLMDNVVHLPGYDTLVVQAALLFGGCGAMAVVLALQKQGRHGAFVALTLATLMACVATVYALYVLGPFANTPGGPIWEIRDLLFLAIISFGITTQGLWDLRGSAARWIGLTLPIVAMLLVANQLVGILQALPGTSLLDAMSLATVAILLPAAILALSRRIGLRPTLVDRTQGQLRVRALAEPAVRLERGNVLGSRYELQTRIRPHVWRAWDRMAGHAVVVKLADHDEARREARASAVRHPALVSLADVQPTNQGTLLVYQELDGDTLWELDAAGRPHPPGLAADITAALGKLHAAGLVHGDVKPDNVMVQRDGTAVLLDLGSVRPGRPTEFGDDLRALQLILDGSYWRKTK